MKKYELTRAKYKEIKKYDHQQMTGFISRLVENAYLTGKSEAQGLNEGEVRSAVLSVKGIGDAKADAIVEALTKADAEKRGAVWN